MNVKIYDVKMFILGAMHTRELHWPLFFDSGRRISKCCNHLKTQADAFIFYLKKQANAFIFLQKDLEYI